MLLSAAEAASDYGPLRSVVSGALCIMAAGGAVGAAWKGRAKWEPSEEDVAKGPQKVGALVSSISIVLLWTQYRGPDDRESVVRATVVLGAACLFFLCVYGFSIAAQTYNALYVGSDGTVQGRKIIGGFRRTKTARQAQNDNKVTTQELFEGAAYDPDKVWTRASLAFAKLIFVIGYLGMTVSGTVALACAAILLAGA